MTKKFTQTVPEMQSIERDLSKDRVIAARGYQIASWRDGPPHSDIPPSEVHVVIPLGVGDIKVAVRLKSARALDELVGVLLQHRKDVWPE